jgi:hypothetical protein
VPPSSRAVSERAASEGENAPRNTIRLRYGAGIGRAATGMKQVHVTAYVIAKNLRRRPTISDPQKPGFVSDASYCSEMTSFRAASSSLLAAGRAVFSNRPAGQRLVKQTMTVVGVGRRSTACR